MRRCVLCPAEFELVGDDEDSAACPKCRRTCSLCRMPTGHKSVNSCPMCEKALSFIEAAHTLGGDRGTLIIVDPVQRERRIEKYRRRADEKQPLFD